MAVHPSPEVRAGAAAPALFVLVGGVPGAGKSTLLARVAGETAEAVVVDPDVLRRWFATTLPRGVPYRSYRFLVHSLHAAATLGLVLRGPSRGRRVLLVHEPATRPRRRELLGRVARGCGWRPVLVLIDVPREEALVGQVARGRVVDPRSFARHWERWSAQRRELAGVGARGGVGAWSGVHVVERRSALSRVRALLAGDVVGDGGGHDPVSIGGAGQRSGPAVRMSEYGSDELV